ncbi:MAG: 50S ribosomal protein L18 [Candidatus Pacebacteria bacterium]|nr:50S ribosomal protein L18 [Candidatus Paceibacterota bacterium]
MLRKKLQRKKRHKRVRSKISGNSNRPRLCVFRSLKHIYCQIIDDEKRKTLVSSNDFELKGTKTEKAKKLGELIAKKAIEKKIKMVVFDKGGFNYTGRIKTLADSARENGLKL